MTNYFELYGLPVSFSPDQPAVKSKYYELSRLHHPDRYAQAGGTAHADALRASAANNEAYKILRSPEATMAHILRLNGLLEHDEKYALPPAFLMEMMELNEAISEYEQEPDNEDAKAMAANSLAEQLQLWDAATRRLTESYDNGEHGEALLLQVKDQYFRKKYLLRIQERIDRFATRQKS